MLPCHVKALHVVQLTYPILHNFALFLLANLLLEICADNVCRCCGVKLSILVHLVLIVCIANHRFSALHREGGTNKYTLGLYSACVSHVCMNVIYAYRHHSSLQLFSGSVLFCRCSATAMSDAPLPNAVGAPLLNPICTICQRSLDDTQLLIEAAKTKSDTTGADISAMIKEKLPYPTRGACCRANLLGKPLCFTDMCGKTMKVEESLDTDELSPVPDSPFFAQWKQAMSIPAANMLNSMEKLLCSAPIAVYVGANEQLSIQIHRLETPSHLPDGTFASQVIGTVSLTDANGRQHVIRNTTVAYFPCPGEDNMLCIKGLSRASNQNVALLPNINLTTIPLDSLTRVTHFSCRTDSFLPAAQQMHRKVTQIELQFKNPKGNFDDIIRMVRDLRIPQATISVSEKQKRYKVPVMQWIRVLLSLEDAERLRTTLGPPAEGDAMLDVEDKWMEDIFIHHVVSRIPENINALTIDIVAAAKIFLRYNSALPVQDRPSDKLISHCVISTSDKLIKVPLLLKMMADGFLVSMKYKLPDEKAHFQAIDGCQSVLISEFLISMRSQYSRLLRSLALNEADGDDDQGGLDSNRKRAYSQTAQRWIGRTRLKSWLRIRKKSIVF